MGNIFMPLNCLAKEIFFYLIFIMLDVIDISFIIIIINTDYITNNSKFNNRK